MTAFCHTDGDCTAKPGGTCIPVGGNPCCSLDLPDGLADVSCYPALIAELLERGWSEQDCARLAGGNVLRVLREAEAAAAAISARRGPSTLRIEDADPGAGDPGAPARAASS